MNCHGFVKTEPHINQKGLPVNLQPAICFSLDVTRKTGQITKNSRAANAQASGNFSLAETFRVVKQKNFDLEQAFGFCSCTVHAFHLLP